jgi:GntR family transcriptional regulator, galactonate operon transcriptional repressor
MRASPTTQDGELFREARLHERAAVVLAADVVSGRLAPGDAFPSAEELIQRFRFSRTVAREVLQTLSMLGLVRVQHGKRTEVRPQEDWNFLSPVMQEALRRENQLEPVWRDLYDFRLVVEPQAAAWMAARGSDRDLARLAALAAEIRILAEDASNVQRVLMADQAFHQLIAQGSTNRILAGINRSFWDAVSVLWLESESRLSPDELTAVAEQHQQIADAITRRDPEGAAEAMESHLKAAYAVDVGSLSMST